MYIRVFQNPCSGSTRPEEKSNPNREEFGLTRVYTRLTVEGTLVKSSQWRAPSKGNGSNEPGAQQSNEEQHGRFAVTHGGFVRVQSSNGRSLNHHIRRWRGLLERSLVNRRDSTMVVRARG